jgi:hypothetical protein
MAGSEKLIAQYEPQTIRSGNYEAQRQLDFRVVRGQALRIILPVQQAALREAEQRREKRDFQIAMRRRKEPAGATLNEMAKKHGL